MTVKIGHAKTDENNKAKGGKAGDQTNKEVMIQDWYNRGWTIVFRAKDIRIAEKMAKAMEQACNNDNIGYDQSQRTTLYDYAEKCNWDLKKITEKCECDCSSLVAVCANAAGVKVNKNMYTGNQKAALLATGKFELLTASEYLEKADYLKKGDILLGPGHTAIVVSEAAQIKLDSAKNFSKALVGIYKVSASKLNVRQGAGITKKIVVAIPKGLEVTCYGYYTKVLGTNWLYVQFNYSDKKYTGFASAKYLIK
jgi:hypothetical protein